MTLQRILIPTLWVNCGSERPNIDVAIIFSFKTFVVGKISGYCFIFGRFWLIAGRWGLWAAAVFLSVLGIARWEERVVQGTDPTSGGIGWYYKRD